MIRAKEYVKAESLKEAYELNQKRSSIVAGGMMWLKMWNLYKMTIVDLSDLGLDGIEETEEEFRIGCMCSLRTMEQHEGLNGCFNGVFKECSRYIVGTQFRNTATVGGSVFGRFGFSDILTCLLALDTWVELYQGGTIPLSEFVTGKRDRDILVHVIVRKDGRHAAYASQRKSKTDFPLIACGVSKSEDTYYISVGARPHSARLCTVPRTAGLTPEAVAEKAVGEMVFQSNLRAGKDYRKHLAGVYVRRLVERLEKEEF